MNKRFKEVRKALKLTQQELADSLNISKSAVESYEYRNVTIPPRTVSDLCRIYHVNEMWLRTGEGEMLEPVEANVEKALIISKIMEMNSEDYRLKVTDAVVQMDEETVRGAINIARSILDSIDKKTPRR